MILKMFKGVEAIPKEVKCKGILYWRQVIVNCTYKLEYSLMIGNLADYLYKIKIRRNV